MLDGVMSWVVFEDELNPTPPRRSIARGLRDVTNVPWATGSQTHCGYVTAEDSPGACWEDHTRNQCRGVVPPVRLFPDGPPKLEVSRKDVAGDCCPDPLSLHQSVFCRSPATRDAASPVAKPARILKSH
mmetsp:Transcript_55755/g.122118  ORF Transcript_55755/g.122118 Transcript_55755/m.122118 type:complete len:129 (-) Transcript_55755:117-503(-)